MPVRAAALDWGQRAEHSIHQEISFSADITEVEIYLCHTQPD